MFTITIHHLDGPSGLQRHVGYVHVDGEDVQIHDPEGHLDLELPTPTVDDLGRGERRRATYAQDPVVWAYNLPALLRGPYVLAQRHDQTPDWVEQLLEQPQAPAAGSPGSAELIAQLIAGSSAAKELSLIHI